MTQLPTSFLRDALIFKFDWWGPYKIVAGTIGYTRHEQCDLLPGGECGELRPPDRQPQRVMIDTNEQRLSYALTRLEGNAKLSPLSFSWSGSKI